MNGGEDSTAQGRHRRTVRLVALAAQAAQRSRTHQSDTDPVGLRKFDLGLVPASVTPPRTWRHAAWFTVLCSAFVLISLLFAVNALVGHSRPATIDALPNYPGTLGLLPTTTSTSSTASSSEASPSTIPWHDAPPASTSGAAASTSRQHHEDTPTHATHVALPVDSAPANGVTGDPVAGGPANGVTGNPVAGGPANAVNGGPVGEHPGQATHPSNQAAGTPPTSWTPDPGPPPMTSILLAAPPSTSSTEQGSLPPTSSTRPTRVPVPAALPTVTTTSDHGTSSVLTIDVATLFDLTQRVYNGVDKDLHDALVIATGEPRAHPVDGARGDTRRFGVPAAPRTGFRRRHTGYKHTAYKQEQVTPHAGQATANTVADSTASPLPHSME